MLRSRRRGDGEGEGGGEEKIRDLVEVHHGGDSHPEGSSDSILVDDSLDLVELGSVSSLNPLVEVDRDLSA